MQGISILVLLLIELIFILVTLTLKQKKGAFTVGTFITIMIWIPIFYIINN